jgi:hypothetical protein
MVEQMVNKTTFLVGNKKNAGKTTFFKYAVNQLRGHSPFAFLTIGVDGEPYDAADHSHKPAIYTAEGDYIVTTNTRINRSSASFAIKQVFPYRTTLGQLVLAQTIRGGNVELVGSEDNLQLTEIIRFLKDDMHIDTILIDGAANRNTQVASVRDSSFYYILRIDHETLHSDVNKLRTISLISKFPCNYDIKDIHQKRVVEITGAFTESKKELVPEGCDVLVVNDFSKIFLDYAQIAALCSNYQIAYKIGYTLLSVVIILKNVQQQEFHDLIDAYNIQENLIINPYETPMIPVTKGNEHHGYSIKPIT